MGTTDDSVPIKRVRGKREMKQLALAALAALAEAEMPDQIEELHARIFDLGPETICEATLVESGTWQWSFKPMVELVLQEVLDVARAPRLRAEERRERIAWALALAGF